jgi:hypothetical protein
MEITKDGNVYEVDETVSKWIIRAMDGKVKLTYELSKRDFESIDEVQDYFRTLEV